MYTVAIYIMQKTGVLLQCVINSFCFAVKELIISDKQSRFGTLLLHRVVMLWNDVIL